MPQEPKIHLVVGGTPKEQAQKVMELSRMLRPNLPAEFTPDDMGIPTPGTLRKMVETHNLCAAVNFHIPQHFEYMKATIIGWVLAGAVMVLGVDKDFAYPKEWQPYIKIYTVPGNHTRL